MRISPGLRPVSPSLLKLVHSPSLGIEEYLCLELDIGLHCQVNYHHISSSINLCSEIIKKLLKKTLVHPGLVESMANAASNIDGVDPQQGPLDSVEPVT